MPRRPPRLSERDALWAACLEKPTDAAPQLVFADWLAERGEDAELEAGLRARCLPRLELKCRRPKKRSTCLLQLVREAGIIATKRATQMSLTYTNGGLYSGKIVKWGLAESSKKKTPQAFFTVLIENEVDAQGETFDCPSYERTIYRAITDNTVDRLIDDIARLGVELSSFSQLDPDSPNAVTFEGREVQIKCKHETYEGKTNERFDFNFGGGGPAQMEATGVKKLDQLFGPRLKKAAAEKPRPATRTPPAQKTTEQQAEEVF
jgi:uncharacterized protein (TIGR02996 family)